MRQAGSISSGQRSRCLTGSENLLAMFGLRGGAAPDVVFVTGGTALSPVIAEGLRDRLGAIEIVVGDLFGSVATGLGLPAQRTLS